MLSTASKADIPSHHGTVLDVTGAAESAFAPSAGLEADWKARRIGWRQFERRYTDEMRALYRRDRALWIDLVEHAAVMSVTLIGDAQGDEGGVWCHRRLLRDMLIAVAGERGLMLDPDTGSLDAQLLEIRRQEVMAMQGTPLICPVCQRPAGADLPARGNPGYGYCSPACLEKEQASRRRRQWTPDSNRRP